MATHGLHLDAGTGSTALSCDGAVVGHRGGAGHTATATIAAGAEEAARAATAVATGVLREGPNRANAAVG